MEFYCFVTLLTDRDYNRVISTLLGHKLTVTSIGSDLVDTSDDCIGCVLSIKIGVPAGHKFLKKDVGKTRSEIYNVVKETLHDLDLKYFSFIITGITNGGATWHASNVNMTKINERPTGSIYRDNAS